MAVSISIFYRFMPVLTFFAAERARIVKAGGFVENDRVNGKYMDQKTLVVSTIIFLLGNLALSRALGDFKFKQKSSLSPEEQIITADPDITCHEMTEEDEFLVMACDGTTCPFYCVYC